MLKKIGKFIVVTVYFAACWTVGYMIGLALSDK